jgi:hypothetical protein
MAVRAVPITGSRGLNNFNWSALGSGLSGIGSLYSAFNQNKMANKLYKLQKSALDDEKKRKKRSQARLDYASEHYLGHRDNNARLPIY